MTKTMFLNETALKALEECATNVLEQSNDVSGGVYGGLATVIVALIGMVVRMIVGEKKKRETKLQNMDPNLPERRLYRERYKPPTFIDSARSLISGS